MSLVEFGINEFLIGIRELADQPEITASTMLVDLAIDSLAMVDWLFEVEEQTGVLIDEERLIDLLTEESTLGQLYELIVGSSPPGMTS